MKWKQDAQSHSVRLLPGLLSGRQQPLNKAVPYPQERRFRSFISSGLRRPTLLIMMPEKTTPFPPLESCMAKPSNYV